LRGAPAAPGCARVAGYRRYPVDVTSAVHTAPCFSAAEAVRLALDLYGLTAEAEALPSERDQNFLLRDPAGARFVLKIANSAESREILDLQNRAMQHLAAAVTALQFPSVVRDRTGAEIASTGNHAVRLLTWVDGVPMATVQPHSAELLASLGRALGEIDAALATFEHPAQYRDRFYWDLAHADHATHHLHLLSPAQGDLVMPFFTTWKELDWKRLRHSVIHNDANDYNVLVDPTGCRVVAIVDYGDMLQSALVCDLAVALAYAMLDKPEPIAAAALVVAGYHRVNRLNEAEIEALFPLAAARLAMSVCYAAWQAREAPQNAYLNISNRPAWALLERLAKLPAGWPAEVFFHAVKPAPDLLGARACHLGPSLSVSYNRPLHILRGWRQHLYDASGRAYLDCVNNVAHVGHCHPRVVAAAQRQEALFNSNTRYLDERLVEYIERLAATLPEALSVVYLVCSGSEANELALRLARTHTGRNGAIVVDTAYHGNTNALIDLSPYKFDGPGGRGRPAHVQVLPMPDPFRHPGADHAQAIARAVGDSPDLAVFFCESALSCGGQIILPPGYLREAYRAVRAAGGVCVADEVQTGFGRAGSHFWMFETQEVIPDIVTMGKPIGNGHPMGAVATTREIAASFANGMEYFNTFGGNPVSCAIGLAVLDVIRDEGLQENAREIGACLLSGLGGLAARHPKVAGVRGHGLFLGFELVRDPETLEPAGEEAGVLVNRMKEAGVLLSTDGPYHHVIKIKPPMIFSRADAGLLLERLDAMLP
jgi:4-aminobutyrate aminotransferase-like enzyme/Ser/Thr protein kinase RdoA (MazF antagonist)